MKKWSNHEMIVVIVALLFAFIVVIVVFSGFFSIKENFRLSDDSKNTFTLIQRTINPNTIFDTSVLENQVNQKELDYFNQHGIWPWSSDTIDLYTEAVNKNPYIRTFSGDAVLNARKIYNQTAILMILSNQTKEGQFLLTGIQVPNTEVKPLPSGFGDFGYVSELTTLKNDVIKCGSNGSLERTKYLGNGGIFGEANTATTTVNPEELEESVSGFSFVNGPCNPCGQNPDYSCPFELHLKDDTQISPVWKKIWNI
jgi:hypothetical protein